MTTYIDHFDSPLVKREHNCIYWESALIGPGLIGTDFGFHLGVLVIGNILNYII